MRDRNALAILPRHCEPNSSLGVAILLASFGLTLRPFLGSPPPMGSYLSLDGKVTKDQGCTEFAKNQIFGLEIKELASLKQLLFLPILQIDFFNANSLRPHYVLSNDSALPTFITHQTKPTYH